MKYVKFIKYIDIYVDKDMHNNNVHLINYKIKKNKRSFVLEKDQQ